LDNFPESIVLTNLTQDELSEDFVAMKVGDVNLNSSPSLASNPSQDLTFVISPSTTTDGEFVQIDFKSKNHNNISAWQWDLSFDVDKMDFESIESGSLPGFSWSNTGERFLEQGILPIVWINPSGGLDGMTFEDGTTLFSLKFRLKEETQFSKDWLGIETNRIQKTAYRDIQPFNIDLAFEEIIPTVQPDWEVSDFYPNPFDESTAIEFILPQKEKVQFQVFDVSGKIIYQQEWTELAEGKNKIELSGIFLRSAGVYYYKLRTSQNHAEGKIVYTK